MKTRLPNTHQLEEKLTQNRLTHKNSTHIPVTTRSMAMAVLKLSEKYFERLPEDEEKELKNYDCKMDALYENTLSEIKVAMGDDLEATHALDWLDRKAKEPVSNETWDIVAVWVPDKENNYRNVNYRIPLKFVLSLVWKAIKDDKAYIHHLKQFETNEDAQKKWHTHDDRVKRLIFQIKELKSLEDSTLKERNETICHQGIRHDLLGTLNHDHENVNILDDASFVVLSYLKNKIPERFKIQFETSDPENKIKLMRAYFIWLEERNPLALLNIIDNPPIIQQEIHQLFIQHGSDPNHVTVDKTEDGVIKNISLQDWIHDCFEGLSFDVGQDSALNALKELFEMPAPNDAAEIHGEALHAMRAFIKNNYQFQETVAASIAQFNLCFKAYQALRDHKETLLIAEIEEKRHGRRNVMDATEWQALQQQFQNYFIQLTANPNQSFQDQESLKNNAEKILADIQNIKTRASFEGEVTNFFKKLYSKNSLKHKAFSLLLNTNVIAKIEITEQELSGWFQNNNGESILDITPYQMNRILLHAILNDHETWCETFVTALKLVIHFIKSNFDLKHNLTIKIDASSLSKDSYPGYLLNQFEYLLKLKNNEPALRPHRMLVVPTFTIDSTKSWTIFDWDYLKNLLAPEKWTRYYSIHRFRANKAAVQYIIEKDDQEEYGAKLLTVMDFLPINFYREFLEELARRFEQLSRVFAKNDYLKDFIKRYPVAVPFILRHINIDIGQLRECLNLLNIQNQALLLSRANVTSVQVLWFDEFLELIGADQNNSTLNTILKFLDDSPIKYILLKKFYLSFGAYCAVDIQEEVNSLLNRRRKDLFLYHIVDQLYISARINGLEDAAWLSFKNNLLNTSTVTGSVRVTEYMRNSGDADDPINNYLDENPYINTFLELSRNPRIIIPDNIIADLLVLLKDHTILLLPKLTNRILMHAIIQSPAEWSDIFVELLQFIAKSYDQQLLGYMIPSLFNIRTYDIRLKNIFTDLKFILDHIEHFKISPIGLKALNKFTAFPLPEQADTWIKLKSAYDVIIAEDKDFPQRDFLSRKESIIKMISAELKLSPSPFLRLNTIIHEFIAHNLQLLPLIQDPYIETLAVYLSNDLFAKITKEINKGFGNSAGKIAFLDQIKNDELRLRLTHQLKLNIFYKQVPSATYNSDGADSLSNHQHYLIDFANSANAVQHDLVKCAIFLLHQMRILKNHLAAMNGYENIKTLLKPNVIFERTFLLKFLDTIRMQLTLNNDNNKILFETIHNTLVNYIHHLHPDFAERHEFYQKLAKKITKLNTHLTKLDYSLHLNLNVPIKALEDCFTEEAEVKELRKILTFNNNCIRSIFINGPIVKQPGLKAAIRFRFFPPELYLLGNTIRKINDRVADRLEKLLQESKELKSSPLRL